MAFLVVEGKDGAGKALQAKLCVDRIIASGRKVAAFDFPQYERPSSYFVREYLNGRYGVLKDIGPRQASLFYALDRFDVAHDIRAALGDDKIVVSNRYVASNMAHQGGKFDNPVERQEFFTWLYALEYALLGIPKPDLNIILHVSAEAAQRLVDKKGERGYLEGKKRDIHELDHEHLRRAENVYDALVQQFPGEFAFINCMDGDRLLTPEEVHELVWQKVQPLLP